MPSCSIVSGILPQLPFAKITLTFTFVWCKGILTHILVFFRYTYGKPVDGRVLVKFSMVGGRFKDVLVKEIPDQVTGVERRSYIK